MTDIIQVSRTTKKAAQILRAINHKLRQRIYTLIQSQGEMAVTDIYSEIGIDQSQCSQNLAILRNNGLVKTRRDGKYIFYSCNDEYLGMVGNICSKLVNSKP